MHRPPSYDTWFETLDTTFKFTSLPLDTQIHSPMPLSIESPLHYYTHNDKITKSNYDCVDYYTILAGNNFRQTGKALAFRIVNNCCFRVMEFPIGMTYSLNQGPSRTSNFTSRFPSFQAFEFWDNMMSRFPSHGGFPPDERKYFLTFFKSSKPWCELVCLERL